MKKLLPQISFSVLLISVLIYTVGRWIVRDPITDETGDWFLWSGGISVILLLFVKIRGVPINGRKSINIAAACALLFLLALGGWGLLTSTGKDQFAEMAGAIPIYALLLAGLIFLLLVILNVVWRRTLNDHIP